LVAVPLDDRGRYFATDCVDGVDGRQYREPWMGILDSVVDRRYVIVVGVVSQA